MRYVLALLCLGVVACSGDPNTAAVDCSLPKPAETAREALPAPAVSACTAQGWCFEHPLPFRDGLGPMWHKSEQTIFTSARGLVLRLRDDTWEALPALPRPDGLTIEDGTPQPFDIWAAGDAIYIAGAVGDSGVAWVYDGVAWRAYTFEDDFEPRHVWGTRPNEVMMVGAGGARLYKDGTWSDVDAPRVAGQGVWGCKSEFFAAMFQGDLFGDEAQVAKHNGRWQDTAKLPRNNVRFSGISGTSSDNIFASGSINGFAEHFSWHFDGTKWSKLDFGDSPGIHDIVAIDNGQAIATAIEAGVGGTVKHLVGDTWHTRYDRSLTELSAATAEDVLGRDDDSIHQFDGNKWFKPFEFPLESDVEGGNFSGVWGDGQDTLFAISTSGKIAQRVNERWVDMEVPTTNYTNLGAVWGNSATDVYASGGQGVVWHYDGSRWSALTGPGFMRNLYLYSIWGAGPRNVYFGSAMGAVLKFDGVSWSTPVTLAQSVTGIWGSGPNDIWVVGGQGQLAHYDGATWDDTATLPAVDARPRDIWGSGPTDIWIADFQRVWHYDGVTWTETAFETDNNARAIWGRSATDVTVVGSSGMVFHYDGATWSDVQVEQGPSLNAVWGDATHTFAVGSSSTILRR